MKKDFLFRYLHEKKVPIEASAEKTSLVKKILELWGSSDDADLYFCDENSLDAPPPAPVPSRNASHTSLCSLDSLPSGALPTSYFSSLRRTESNLSMMNYDESSNSSFTQNSNAHHTTSLLLSQDSFSSSLQMNQINCTTSSSSIINSGSNSCSSSLASNASMFPTTQSQCQDMAKNFVDWFYKILNTCCLNPDVTEFNQTMFWPDANAKVNLLGNLFYILIPTCLLRLTPLLNKTTSYMFLNLVFRLKAVQFVFYEKKDSCMKCIKQVYLQA